MGFKNKSLKFKKGITIVEIFIGLTLIGILTLLITVIFYSHFKLFSKQSTVIDISSQNKIALEEITNQVLESVSITYPPNVATPIGIFFDAASSTASSGSTSTLTWPHTTSGSNRLLVVGVTIKNRTGQKVGSITYNGVLLTEIGNQNSGTNVRIEMWRLPVEPATGTHDIVVTLSNSAKVVGGATSWTGVNQTTPLGTFISASGSIAGDGNPIVDVSSATNEVVLDTLGVDGNATATAGDRQTQHWNLTTSGLLSDVRGAGSSELGATTTTMSWTLGSFQPWAIGAIPIKPVTEQSYPSASPSASCGGYVSGTQTLVLWLWPTNATGEPFDPGSEIYDCIVYRQDSAKNTLIKKIVPSATSSRTASERIIASQITNLVFSYSPNIDFADEITMTITTTGTVESKDITQTQSAKAVLRNR